MFGSQVRDVKALDYVWQDSQIEVVLQVYQCAVNIEAGLLSFSQLTARAQAYQLV